MEEIIQYIKPELLVLVPVLCFVGAGVKKSSLKDKYIPLVLGLCGVILAGMWIFASTAIGTLREGVLAVFMSLTQGILCAGTSVYAHQLVHQAKKE